MLLLSVININWLLNGVLALIMFGLGLSLKRADFQALFDQPKSLALGLFAQMVLLPFLAALLIYSAPLSPEWKVGIMILSVCPGGITSNLVSYFVKGNVALAVSLTVTNALLSLLSIPLMVNLFLTHFMNDGSQSVSLPFWNTLFHYSGLVGDGDAFAYGQKGGECEPLVERGIAAAVVDCFWV
jgi:BASS family bile acid:Na+ symporter